MLEIMMYIRADICDGLGGWIEADAPGDTSEVARHGDDT
jgi:hypothetical protein